MTTVYIFNFVDRSIVNILAQPISRELQLSDLQIGLLTGLAFTLLYSIAAVPLARYIDGPRVDRARVLSSCVFVWSLATAACGLATSFTALLISRIFVGVGEAGCTPASHSLISDLVPPDKRSTALAIFGIGLPVGSLIGLVIGGYLSDQLGWRAAFLLAGAPGLILAPLLLLLRDPRPKASSVSHGEAPGEPAPARISTWANICEPFKSAAFGWLLVGGGVLAFLIYGRATWNVAYFTRSYGLSLTQVGLVIGLSGGTAGLIGTYLGGKLADRFGPINPKHYLTPAVLAYVAAVPVYLAVYSVADWRLAAAFLFVAMLLDSMSYGPSWAAIQSVTPPQSRGMAVALKLLIQSIVGGGLGPVLLGALSDHYKATAGAESVRMVLWSTSFLGLAVALAFYLASLRLPKELLHLQSSDGTAAGYDGSSSNSALPKSVFRDGAQPGSADMMISRTPVSAATWPTKAKISAFSV